MDNTKHQHPTKTMELINDLEKIYAMAPVWRASIWKAVQENRYDEVEIKLSDTLKGFSKEDWQELYLKGLIVGIPSFRGNLNEKIWEENVLPAVAKAIRSAASDEIIHSISSSLDDESLKKFRALVSRIALDEHPKNIGQKEGVADTVIFNENLTKTVQTPQGMGIVVQEPARKPDNSPTQKEGQAPQEKLHPHSQPTSPQPPITPAQEAHKQSADDRSELLTPAFGREMRSPERKDTPETEGANTNQAPFLIHEESEIQPLASRGMAPLDRPQFFKSTAKEKPKEEPSKARLEIGAEEEVLQGPRVGKTKKETVRRVDYAAPPIQADPFKKPEENPNAPEKKGEKPPHEVSPENIVNLKDLPK